VKNAMGAFFTFNKEILTKVGACDEKNFKIRGEWHIDYSNRCCKAGFNNADRFYDCINSDKFLTLQNFEDEENYKCSIEWDEYKHLRTKDELKRRKNIIDNPNRLYIPFNSNQEYTTTNQVFDNIYVINLDRSFSRWEKVMKACRETGINIERFSAVDGKNPEVLKQYERYNSLPLRKNPSFIKKITSSKEYYLDFRHSIARIAFLEEKCNQHSIKSAGAYAYALTYIKILEDAIQKKYQNILILDDDVLLHKNYNFLFRDSFKTLPNNWKLIMLGACQYDWDEWITPFNEHFYHCNGSSVASHAVGISSKMFLQLLHIAKKLDMPIDEGAVTHIQSNYKNDCYINFPNLMIQDTSDSEINSSDSQLDEGTLTNNTYRWNLNNYVKNSKFDILFVMESFPNLPETFIINEICKFIENGYSVGVISLRDPRWNRLQNPKVKKFHLYERTIYLENYKNKLTATEKDTLFNKSLKEIQIEKKYKKYISKYFKNKQREQYKYEALEILKFVINQKPEKIYGHFGNIGDILAPISKITSTPLYTFFHGFDFSRLPKLGWNYSELFKIAKHIFTNTNYSAEKVKNLGCNPKQISVIGIGMETSSYSFRVRKPEQNFKFVTVARLVEKKGLKYSLKAFELLSKEFSNI
jgi:GR25 family glycosyltransferase involved in LPS biosynthesis